MMKKYLNLKLIIGVIVGIAILLIPITAMAASPKDAVCQGAGAVGDSGSSCGNPAGNPDINDVIQTGLNLFSAVVGIIAVVFVMLGGVKYMTSQGEAAKVNEAKNSVLYAVVGIIIVAMAQVIVRFVLKRFTTV